MQAERELIQQVLVYRSKQSNRLLLHNSSSKPCENEWPDGDACMHIHICTQIVRQTEKRVDGWTDSNLSDTVIVLRLPHLVLSLPINLQLLSNSGATTTLIFLHHNSRQQPEDQPRNHNHASHGYPDVSGCWPSIRIYPSLSHHMNPTSFIMQQHFSLLHAIGGTTSSHVWPIALDPSPFSLEGKTPKSFRLTIAGSAKG